MEQKESSSSSPLGPPGFYHQGHDTLLLFFRGSFKNFRPCRSLVRQGFTPRKVEGFTLGGRKDSPPASHQGWRDSLPQGGRIHSPKEEGITSSTWKKAPPHQSLVLQPRELSTVRASVLLPNHRFEHLDAAIGGRIHSPQLYPSSRVEGFTPLLHRHSRKGGRNHLPHLANFQVEAFLTALPPWQ